MTDITDMPLSRPAIRVRPALLATVTVALLGAAFYGWLTLLSASAPHAAFGQEIYDQLWLALREGRLDLPARVLRIEGHYTPDGTGYSYHGIAPLLLRALADPFVTLGAGTLAPLSVWLWAALGSLACQITVLGVLPREAAQRTGLAIVVSGFAWFGSPGVLLAANHAFYQEPIAVAYALFALFMLGWTRAGAAGRVSGVALVALAALAALSVHARPHLAIAMYSGVALLIGWALLQRRLKALLPALIAVAVLGAGGLGYLGLNALRFGDATATHGGFDAGQSQYGTTFWGLEDPESERARAFREHGRFNPGRIGPNLLMYLASPPQVLSDEANRATRALHRAVTEPFFGRSRIESPDAGIVFLWTFWAAAAAIGLASLRHARRDQLALVAVTGIAAALILSYATITLRYRVDLWPLLFALALIGLPRLARAVTTPGAQWPRRVLILSLLGCVINVQTAAAYRDMFREVPGTAFAAWDKPTCEALAAQRGLAPDRIIDICRDAAVEGRQERISQ